LTWVKANYVKSILATNNLTIRNNWRSTSSNRTNWWTI